MKEFWTIFIILKLAIACIPTIMYYIFSNNRCKYRKSFLIERVCTNPTDEQFIIFHFFQISVSVEFFLYQSNANLFCPNLHNSLLFGLTKKLKHSFVFLSAHDEIMMNSTVVRCWWSQKFLCNIFKTVYWGDFWMCACIMKNEVDWVLKLNNEISVFLLVLKTSRWSIFVTFAIFIPSGLLCKVCFKKGWWVVITKLLYSNDDDEDSMIECECVCLSDSRHTSLKNRAAHSHLQSTYFVT